MSARCPYCDARDSLVILTRHPSGGLLVECLECHDSWVEEETRIRDPRKDGANPVGSIRGGLGL